MNHLLCCRLRPTLLVLAVLAAGFGRGLVHGAIASDYSRWTNGPSRDASFFPIGVWLQNPAHAARYREAGINLFVGLWQGPTETQLTALKSANMRVVCDQNNVARKHLDDPVIAGWMHGDEPDNAQSLGAGKGYGPPVAAAKIIADFERIRTVDPSRPVLLNLGQGVAWDRWHGRGVRTNHPEDYPEYVKGCDIASFDIYPVTHDSPEVAGQLQFVARGVERLRGWVQPGQIVWNCIECTRISNRERKPTPWQVKAEVWMSLIHGSGGLIYFVHEWEPKFREAALLDDPEMLAGVTAINRQIHELAPVLNSILPTPTMQVVSAKPAVPVAAMIRRHERALYVFAVGMRNGDTQATFTLKDGPAAATVTVLGENRVLRCERGMFSDEFKAWEAHLYRMELD